MKLIHPGQIDEVDPLWWVGRRLSCPSCRAVFELEAGDDVTARVDRRSGGSRAVTATCPTCGDPATWSDSGSFTTITWNSPLQPTHIEPSWPVLPNPLPLTIMSTATANPITWPRDEPTTATQAD